jgi:tetratricopeptide (TPR) repeat protein
MKRLEVFSIFVILIPLFSLEYQWVFAQDVFLENPPYEDQALDKMRLRNEGIAHFEAGISLKKALTAFQKAYDIEPRELEDIFNLALIHHKLGDTEEAEQYLLEAIKQNDNFANAYYVLGLIRKDEGEFEQAKALFEKARALFPDDSYLHYNLALISLQLENQHDYLQSLIHALQLDPENTGALYQLFQYYSRSGNKTLAKNRLQELSRVKKVQRTSRKETREDESQLSLPIRNLEKNPYRFSPLASEIQVNVVNKKFTKPIVTLDYMDIDGDGIEEIFLLTQDQHIIFFDPNGAENEKMLGELPKNTHRIEINWLNAKSDFVVVGVADKGIFKVNNIMEKDATTDVIVTESSETFFLHDVDRDGDLDLLSPVLAQPLTNRGNGVFFQEDFYKAQDAFKQLKNYRFISSSDLNRVGRQDLVVINQTGEFFVLKDAGGGTYHIVPSDSGEKNNYSDVIGLNIADFDNDGYGDLVFLKPNQIQFQKNQTQYQFVLQSTINSENETTFTTIRIVDFNNDGLKDIVTLNQKGSVDIYLNQGNFAFNKQSLVKSIGATKSQIWTTDFNIDGAVDLLLISDSGELLMVENRSEKIGKSVPLHLQGTRSAKSGDLTQVEIYKSGKYLFYESQQKILNVGIGPEDYVEILRITWPNGFVENKFKVDVAKKAYLFEESERISGSCPSVFTWNGSNYHYVTDAFISGPIGVPLSRGVYFPVDDDEYLRFTSTELKPTDDSLVKIKMTEELKETVYLDKAELYQVEHPVNVKVFPNDVLAPRPEPAFQMIAVSDYVPPVSATDKNGVDVLSTLSQVDGDMVGYTEDRSPFAGYIKHDHWLELEVPDDVLAAENPKLLLNGWFYYFDSTSMIAASQSESIRLGWPRLEQQINGKWQPVDIIGIMPGKDKTIVHDLTGKITSKHIRIISNVDIHWDFVTFDLGKTNSQSLQLEKLELVKAKLDFHGFSSLTQRDPEKFDYHKPRYMSMWNPLEGTYTKYGHVEPLLGEIDNKFVIFSSGDELSLEFKQQNQKPIRQGMTYTYFLYLNGTVKDGDKYTAGANHILPMPFYGMKTYPYEPGAFTEAVSKIPGYEEYLNEYQTRKPFNFITF